MPYVRREDVTGKKVITPDGNSFGDVKDIAFNMDGSVGLVITTKGGSEVIVPLKGASAIGDYVLLSSPVPDGVPVPERPKPSPSPPSAPSTHAAATCPACGGPTKPGAKFCGKCGQKL